MYIKIVGDTAKYQGIIEHLGNHLIRVSGLIQHTSGFQLYLDNDTLIGDYSEYIYPYNNPNLGEGVYEYTDNNMSYDEVEQPIKAEQERQNIESIIDMKVGEDIHTLTQQVIELSNVASTLYESLLELKDKFDAYVIENSPQDVVKETTNVTEEIEEKEE